MWSHPRPPAGLAFSAGAANATASNARNASKGASHLSPREVSALFRSSPLVPFLRGAGFAQRTLPGLMARLGCATKKAGKARREPPPHLGPHLHPLATSFLSCLRTRLSICPSIGCSWWRAGVAGWRVLGSKAASNSSNALRQWV